MTPVTAQTAGRADVCWMVARPLLVLTLGFAAGCPADGMGPPTPLPPPPGLGPIVATLEPASAALTVGDTIRFKARVPIGFIVAHVGWQVTDSTRATVDSIGLLTARAVGSLMVRALVVTSNAGDYAGLATVSIRD